MRLSRTKQCSNCPWKVSTNPFDIPYGYDPEKHKNLACTISDGAIGSAFSASMQAMACHHSFAGDEDYCIGWLVNQLGPGNNIGLRLKMMNCENVDEIEVFGEQHERFEDTLPENKIH